MDIKSRLGKRGGFRGICRPSPMGNETGLMVFLLLGSDMDIPEPASLSFLFTNGQNTRIWINA